MSSATPTQSVAVSQEFTVLQALAAHYLTNKTLTAPVLLSLTAALIAELSNVKTLSLADKKKVICDIIDSSLQNALALSKAGIGSPVLAEDEVVALNYVVKNVVPHTVDLLVATSTGKFDLSTVKATCWSSFKLCVPAVEAKLRGPAWDVADAFVVAAEKSVAKGGSVAAVVAAVAEGAGAAAAVAEVKSAVAAVVKTESVVPDWSAPRVDLSGSTVSSNPV